MIARFRRPLTWVRLVGVVVAILLGLAIAGPPSTARDVPLRDRHVAATR